MSISKEELDSITSKLHVESSSKKIPNSAKVQALDPTKGKVRNLITVQACDLTSDQLKDLSKFQPSLKSLIDAKPELSGKDNDQQKFALMGLGIGTLIGNGTGQYFRNKSPAPSRYITPAFTAAGALGGAYAGSKLKPMLSTNEGTNNKPDRGCIIS